MSNDDSVFRRVGRGGAGNWYSKKDVQEAADKETLDVEAQKPTGTEPGATVAQSPEGPAYTRAGRGGAGNFYDAGAGSDPAVAAKEEAQKTKAAVAAHSARPRTTGLGGRGGAGNWGADLAAEQQEREEENKRRLKELEEKVLQDVESGLAMPARAYRSHDRESE